MSSPLKPDNAALRATALPMASNQNPTDLARETLKLLATRRIAPTPANYQRIYQEISGVGGSLSDHCEFEGNLFARAAGGAAAGVDSVEI